MIVCNNARSEVLTTVVMKSFIFRDIALCTSLKVSRRLKEHVDSFFTVEE
jgi:hypothetical protein